MRVRELGWDLGHAFSHQHLHPNSVLTYTFYNKNQCPDWEKHVSRSNVPTFSQLHLQGQAYADNY